MAVVGTSRSDRRVPAAETFCIRSVHPVLPDHRIGHDEQRAESHRAGRTRDSRRTDLRHERVPGAEGQTGVRGADAQPGNRLPRLRRGV